MIENVLATLDRNLEDSASDLGASDLQVPPHHHAAARRPGPPQGGADGLRALDGRLRHAGRPRGRPGIPRPGRAPARHRRRVRPPHGERPLRLPDAAEPGRVPRTPSMARGAQLRHGDRPRAGGRAAADRAGRRRPGNRPDRPRLPGRPAPDGSRRDGRRHALRRHQQRADARALHEPPGHPVAGALPPDGRRGGRVRGRRGAPARLSHRADAVPRAPAHRAGRAARLRAAGHGARDRLRPDVQRAAAPADRDLLDPRHQLRLPLPGGGRRGRARQAGADRPEPRGGVGRPGREPPGDVRPGRASAHGHRLPGRPHLCVREQHADAERHRLPHLAGSRAGGVGDLRVRAHGRDGARLGSLAPGDRRGPRRPRRRSGRWPGGAAASRSARRDEGQPGHRILRGTGLRERRGHVGKSTV